MSIQYKRNRVAEDEIVEAFARSFTKHGYLGTSVNSIALELGIAKGSVSYYIGSKEAILYRVHLEGIREFTEMLREIADSPLPAEQRLRAAIHDSLRRVDPEAGPLFHLSKDTRYLKPEHQATIAKVKREYLGLFTRIIEEGIDSGVFQPQTNLKVIIFGILRFVGLVKDWYNPDEALSLPEIAETYWEFICRGLGYQVTRKECNPTISSFE